MMPEAEGGASLRSFSLNSEEAYAALCPPRDPWVWAGGLPREPRARDLPVIVERKGWKR